MLKKADFKPFLAYSASAGSGKTFALSVRYISLLFMDVIPSNILAATFTNKAASEMKQRIIDSLREIPLMLNHKSKEVFLEKISEQTGLSYQEIIQKQPEVLSHFLASSSYIVTLDSFFSGILRSASLELGIEPDFVTKTEESGELETHFLSELDREGLLSNLVKLAMDIEDKRFTKIFDLMQNFYKVDALLPHIEIKESPLLKQEKYCRVLQLEMIEMLKDAGATPRAIKLFEAKNIKALFIKKLFEKVSLSEHSYCKKVVNEPMEKLYQKLKIELARWSHMKEEVVLQNLFSLYSYYKNAIKTNVTSSGILTFDDLTYFTYRLLYQGMSSDFLYFKIDAKFKHILLDEFQDTSTLQFLLLQPLIDEIVAGVGQSEFKSFFYVGDVKQSLYRFRGGVEELFHKVAEDYTITIEQMDTNYRSSKNVVEQVNSWFMSLPDTNYVPQKTKEGALDGFVEVIEVDDALEIIDSAVAKAEEILALGVNIDDIAFLVSTNKDGQKLQEACHKANIQTLLKTSSSLKSLPKISALVAMVSYLFYKEKIDAQAMLTKVGQNLETIDTSWFHAFMTPLEVLDRLIRLFGYFDNDVNILKLVEFSASFSDIPTFLEEFEISEISVASKSIRGAKIMTIHGSKGLEFEYVIVLDKLTGKKADTSALIYDYKENLSIGQILYRTKNREIFDTHYGEILEKRKKLSSKDSNNVLYVALTRAVEGLIIIKKEKASIFDALGVEVMRKGVVHPKKKEKKKITQMKLHKEKPSCYGLQNMIEENEEEEKDYDALLFGLALHYALEMLSSFEEVSLNEAMVSVQNKFGQELNNTILQSIKSRIMLLLKNETFLTLLKGATLKKELSLSFNQELKKIDLLVEHPNENIVIDYKSSQKFQFKHKEQVLLYKKAITTITQKPTRAIIFYLLEDEIIFLEL